MRHGPSGPIRVGPVQDSGTRPDPRADPLDEPSFAQVARSKSQHPLDDLIFGSFEVQVVQAQEDDRGEEGCSLVSISEWMVRADPIRVVGREPGKIGDLLEAPPLPGPRQGRFQLSSRSPIRPPCFRI